MLKERMLTANNLGLSAKMYNYSSMVGSTWCLQGMTTSAINFQVNISSHCCQMNIWYPPSTVLSPPKCQGKTMSAHAVKEKQ